MPWWVEVTETFDDKWFRKALENTEHIYEGTYEVIGKHFHGNLYKMDLDCLVHHGFEIIEVPRTFEGIKELLENNEIEGVVFWKMANQEVK